MRKKIQTPTEAEIATRKRLRLIGQWFNTLNIRLVANSSVPDGDGLPAPIRKEIDEQKFEPADLMAIRNEPFKWTRSNPYQWLWLLHRYQNSSK